MNVILVFSERDPARTGPRGRRRDSGTRKVCRLRRNARWEACPREGKASPAAGDMICLAACGKPHYAKLWGLQRVPAQEGNRK